MPGFCEPDDVRQALQEKDLSGNINPTIVETAIEGITSWVRKRATLWVYDSNGADDDLVPTDASSASTVRLDVPSSPHRQDRQLFHGDERGWRYPVTQAGPYVRIRLPHRYVDALTTLEVRDRGGGVTDWTSDADTVEGRGEDYYVQVDRGDGGYGTSHLYLRAASIGPRTDYSDLLTVGYDHGLDAQDGDWQDVRRGVALLSAAQIVTDDDVLSQVPDNARLVGVDTQRSAAVDDALAGAVGLLQPYLEVGVA